jgi:FKBP-type peptidyl-prolyl cis-trans isomerase FkpA
MKRASAFALGTAFLTFFSVAPHLDAAAQESAASRPEIGRAFTRLPAPYGIQIRRFNKTDGAQPERTDRVSVHYRGTLKDGSVFDSSAERGRPAVFYLKRMIPCWTEALIRLHVGERAEIVCPPDTAYGARGAPPSIPPDATLTFQIELLGIQ